MNWVALLEVLFLGIATGVAAMTATKASISKPLRSRILAKSPFWGELVNCPYCASHWIGAAAVILYQPRVFGHGLVLDLVVSWLVVIFVASIVAGLIYRSLVAIPGPAEEAE